MRRLILPLLLALAWIAPAHAQQFHIYCNVATQTPCTPSSQPLSTGDQVVTAMGKAEANFTQWYGVTGIVKGNGSSATPTAAASGDLLSVIGTVPAANGGLGVASPTGVLFHNGASAATVATSSQILGSLSLAANTVLCNATGSTASPTACSVLTTPVQNIYMPLNTANGSLGNITIIGVGAGTNASLAAYENTFVGWSAGGSGANTGDGGGGGTGLTTTGLENTCVGWACMTQMTSGQFNVAMGNNAMGHETTGSSNAVVGEDAYRNVIGGSDNVAMGSGACRNGNGISGNVCIGFDALENITDGFPNAGVTGTGNVAVGLSTMGNGQWTTGSNNVAVGEIALAKITTGNDNVAVGGGALSTTTTAGQHVAVGKLALSALTTGTNDVGVGWSAGLALTTGSGDTFIGWDAAALVTTSSDDTVIGQSAGTALTGAQSTFVGSHAGQHVTSGTQNLVLGYNVATTTLTTGGGNILIGNSASVDTAAAGTNSELNIGATIRGSMAAVTGGGNITSCGSGPTAVANSTSMAGTITTGTGATACTITLNGIASGVAPTCLVTARSGTAPVYTTADNSSTATLTLTTAAASATYDYWCPVH